MAKMGNNLKISIGVENREAMRRFMAEGLGAELRQSLERVDLFMLGDGYNVGLFYVPASRALSDEQALYAPWLELSVDGDGDARVLAAGAVSVSYDDPTHRYYRMPGGPIFRLASVRH